MAIPEETLQIPSGIEGLVWFYDVASPNLGRPHRHWELEFNLVARGTAQEGLGPEEYRRRL